VFSFPAIAQQPKNIVKIGVLLASNPTAAAHKLPSIYGQREFVDAGGLMSYGHSSPDMFRRPAT
jgi:hypothetical protein